MFNISLFFYNSGDTRKHLGLSRVFIMETRCLLLFRVSKMIWVNHLASKT